MRNGRWWKCAARAVVADGAFKFIRLTAGGVAPVPLRLTASEAALQGKAANAATIAEAARLATSGAKPLPMTGYKLDLLEGVVRDLLERLADRETSLPFAHTTIVIRRACSRPCGARATLRIFV